MNTPQFKNISLLKNANHHLTMQRCNKTSLHKKTQDLWNIVKEGMTVQLDLPSIHNSVNGIEHEGSKFITSSPEFCTGLKTHNTTS